MPFADNRNKPWVLEHLCQIIAAERIESVVDVGAGAGANLEFYGPWFENASWTAIEAWEPYVERFVLSRYSTVLVGDVRQFPVLPECDVLLLGDVIEHMGLSEAIELWQRALNAARVVVLSLPIVHYDQDAWGGNPFEEHRHHWSEAEVLAKLPRIQMGTTNETTGAYIAEGRR